MAMDKRRRFTSVVVGKPALLALPPLFALYLVTRTVNIKGVPIFIDEAIYLKWARDAQSGHMWASLLWDGKPPLHSWSMVPLLGVFRDPLLAGRLTSVFFGALTMVGMILIGKELMNLEFGVFTGFLYAICPFALFYDRLAIAECMLQALFVFAIYFAVKAARSGKLVYLVGTSIATGMALLTKGTATLLFVIVPFAYLVRGPKERDGDGRLPMLRWGLTVGLSLLLGFAILNLLRLSPKYAARSHYIATRSKGITAALATPLKTFFRFNASILLSMVRYLTPVLFAVAVFGLVLGLAKRWRPGDFLWAWVIIGASVISLVGRFTWARFYLVLVPPLLLAAAYALHEASVFILRAWRRRQRPGRVPVAAVSAIALLALMLAVLVPAASLSAGMIRGTQGEADYLKGRDAGIGMIETAGMIKDLSRNRAVNVVVNDYFVQLVLQLYTGNDTNLHIVTLQLEYRKGFTDFLRNTYEKAASERPTFLIINGASTGIPSSWPLQVIREFKKDEGGKMDSMFVTRVKPDTTTNTAPGKAKMGS